MCYDISFLVKGETVLDYLPHLKIDPQISLSFEPKIHLMAPLYPKAPPVHYPVIIFENGEYRLVEFLWNLIPTILRIRKDIQKKGGNLCNARSEKLLDPRSLWYQYRNNRCLVPMSSIFEHRKVQGFKNKIPYAIKLKGREMFALPGLYNYSPIPDPETGEVKGTFTFFTRAANSVMRAIHNDGPNAFRMPLFLNKELEQKWLLPDLTDQEMKEITEYEMPSEELDYWTVHTIRTTKPRPDEKSKIDPYAWENLPQLQY
ncbi:MAG: SOS response-associated peptidase family protein [Bacteroidetes bacterium]|nr:SOS response-associated peptidase family protein [Bacteroidota bacterium]